MARVLAMDNRLLKTVMYLCPVTDKATASSTSIKGTQIRSQERALSTVLPYY